MKNTCQMASPPGDHPLTDMLVHSLNIYPSLARDLVRISNSRRRKTRRELGDPLLREYNNYRKPDIVKIEVCLIGR
jgi:hypothetical protein